MWPEDCSRRTGTAARVMVDDAPEVGLDLSAEVILREVLDGVDVGIAGVVDENVQPAEDVGCCLDRGGCLRAVGHGKANRFGTAGIAPDEILKLVRVSGCGDDILASGQRRLGQRAAKAARASGDEPSTRQDDSLPIVVRRWWMVPKRQSATPGSHGICRGSRATGRNAWWAVIGQRAMTATPIRPPSTSTTVPLTNRDSSEAR